MVVRKSERTATMTSDYQKLLVRVNDSEMRDALKLFEILNRSMGLTQRFMDP